MYRKISRLLSNGNPSITDINIDKIRCSQFSGVFMNQDEPSSSREIDKEYLALLERKLKNLKDPGKATAKQFISDIASKKDYQLFTLLTAGSGGFEDDFVIDSAITPNYIQRKVAPQTCAINKQERVKLILSDFVDKLRLEEEQREQEEKQSEEVVPEVPVPKEKQE